MPPMSSTVRRPHLQTLADNVTARVRAGDLGVPRGPDKYGYEAAAAYYSDMAGKLVDADFTPQTVVLSKPILILQTKPHLQLDVFKDSQLLDGASFIQLQIADTAAGSQYRQFVFFYLWVNPSAAFAVVNLSTNLVLNGTVTLSANTGFFSGDHTDFSAAASLVLWRNGGWGTDPTTGVSLDQTVYPGYAPTLYVQIAQLAADGGSVFGHAGFAQQSFAGTEVDLSYPQMVIPGFASSVFMVTISINTTVSDYEISNSVNADFATDANRITSPGLTIQVLTPVAE